jgi:5'-methylthioadenosine phosphorylase
VVTGARATVGVFGGSGFYSFLDDASSITIDTPWGAPSAPVTIGTVGTTSVAFIPRHGRAHEHLPHEVPARANLWAMHALGVRRVLAPCAVGSLRTDYEPGDLVLLDQLVDRTWGRPSTFFDRAVTERGGVFHLPFADPYCSELRELTASAAAARSFTMHDTGTVVVIQGPRFSTRAESRWYRDQGWDVVNMTQTPEAALAAELGMCYCGVALVTDYDSGVEDDPAIEPVTMDQVFALFDANIERVRDLLLALIPSIPHAAACGCAARRGPIDALPSD